jgi:hypothetical protein
MVGRNAMHCVSTAKYTQWQRKRMVLIVFTAYNQSVIIELTLKLENSEGGIKQNILSGEKK